MKEKGINQVDIARLVDRPANTISNWIRRGTEPTVSDGYVIASHLGVDVETLVTGTSLADDPVLQRIKYDKSFAAPVYQLAKLDDKAFYKICGMIDIYYTQMLDADKKESQGAG